MRLFYISFASETVFLGATCVRAESELDAVRRTWSMGINPGGEAMICEVPVEAESAPDIVCCLNRLATEAEMRAMGAVAFHELPPDEQSALEIAYDIEVHRNDSTSC